MNWLKDSYSACSFRVRQAISWGRNATRQYRRVGQGLGALFIAAPPYLISQYYQTDKFAQQIKADWPLVSAMLDHHVVVGVLAAGAWAFLVMSIMKWFSGFAHEQPSGWQNAPSVLLTALDNVVGSKEQRFSKQLQVIQSGGSSDPSEVFKYITQPVQQLNELVHAIYSTFDSLLRTQVQGKYVLKVNLAGVAPQGDINGIFFHYPSNHPVRSSVASLNDPNSAIKNAIRTSRIVVLESILLESQRSKARFVVTDQSRAEEDGSLICYPIVYDPMGAVVFVVSIHVDQPGIFKPKFSNAYAELLKPFALRMKLEYALMALKEATNGQTN